MIEQPMAPTDPEELLAQLPTDVGLDAATAAGFVAQRRRIHLHHRQWRSNMPAIDELFEDDDHRAKALAANLATQLEQVGMAWADACTAAPRRSVHSREMRHRIEDLAERWRVVTLLFRDQQGWDEPVLATFDDFFDRLVQRACRRAIERFDAARQTTRSSGGRRLRRMLGRAMRGVFHPGGE